MPTFVSPRAKKLLVSLDVAQWSSAMQRYDDCMLAIASTKKGPKATNLIPYDRWVAINLPSIIEKRGEEAHITKPELQRLMRWKLNKGKFRPGLQKYVDSLPADDVKNAS